MLYWKFTINGDGSGVGVDNVLLSLSSYTSTGRRLVQLLGASDGTGKRSGVVTSPARRRATRLPAPPACAAAGIDYRMHATRLGHAWLANCMMHGCRAPGHHNVIVGSTPDLG